MAGENSINWKIAGLAGQGIKNAGEMFSRLMCRHGFDVVDYTEFPSLIKGGHNTYQVLADKTQARSPVRQVDVLVCLSKNALVFHQDELTDETIILIDLKDERVDPTQTQTRGKLVDVPFFSLAKTAGSTQRLIGNTVAIAASAALLGLDFEELNQLIADTFAGKAEVIAVNQKAAGLGFDFVSKLDIPKQTLEKQAGTGRVSLSGAEAIGLGAIAGGLQFYCAYPMSPSTPVLHYLAEKAQKYPMVVKQGEDEIGVVNMTLGASFAGVRAMCGTSGGGFCYMTEALGFAGVAELPLVVMLAMRPGPALGMPTWTSQSDLYFAIYASHDEFPRFVLAPGDMEECFTLSKKSLELAEAFQTLVILLSDKDLNEGRGTINPKVVEFTNSRYGFIADPKPDSTGFFPRYFPTDSGISYRTVPGQSDGVYFCSSYDHDRYGLTNEDDKVRREQMEKRFRKFEAMKKVVPRQTEVRTPDAEVGLITFGSAKKPASVAVDSLNADGVKTSWLNLSWLWPFPKQQIEEFLSAHDQVVVVENNFTGQLANLITQETGNTKLLRFNKYDGRPFFPEEIVNEVKTKYGS